MVWAAENASQPSNWHPSYFSYWASILTALGIILDSIFIHCHQLHSQKFIAITPSIYIATKIITIGGKNPFQIQFFWEPALKSVSPSIFIIIGILGSSHAAALPNICMMSAALQGTYHHQEPSLHHHHSHHL